MERHVTKNSVFEYLKTNCCGRLKTIKAEELAVKLGTTIREISFSIHDLREEGNLIGSAKNPPYGYYLPANPEEVKLCLNTYKSELMDMLRVYGLQKRAAKAYLESVAYEGELFIKEPGSGQLVLPGFNFPSVA